MRIVSAAALLVALACGGETLTGPPTKASIAGRWSLQTVNGATLPWVIAQSGTAKSEVMSDVLALSETGTFVQTTVMRNTLDGQATTTSASEPGSYSLRGTAATFVFDIDGSWGTGSIDGDRLTITGNGFATVYVKQK